MYKLLVFLVLLFSLFTIPYTLYPSSVHAVCPVCTVAVAGGLGLSRYFGIDDAVIGIWVGGLMVSLTLWTVDWIKRKKFKIFEKTHSFVPYLVSLLFYILITYPPLFWSDVIGHPFNQILGIDKLIFGSIIGFIAFLTGVYLDKKARQKFGKQFFNYQKVVFPVTALIFSSLVIYFWGGYLYQL